MSVGTADVHKAILAAWSASTLDASFKALWPAAAVAASYYVLHDQEAAPGQPMPYAVVDESVPAKVDRMSGGVNALREVRDVPIKFNVHATEASGDSRTAKEIAAAMAEEIMKVFGGHPTATPTGTITLDNGRHLITEVVNDYGIRMDDDKFYQWVLDYIFRIDVPVMV